MPENYTGEHLKSTGTNYANYDLELSLWSARTMSHLWVPKADDERQRENDGTEPFHKLSFPGRMRWAVSQCKKLSWADTLTRVFFVKYKKESGHVGHFPSHLGSMDTPGDSRVATHPFLAYERPCYR
jgi:hypothetical protein